MSTPNLKKWKSGKRLAFVQRNVRSQVEMSEDLRVEIIGVGLCECGNKECSGIKARIMPLMYMATESGEKEWVPLSPMVECGFGIFTELVHAMWKLGKHLDKCKCTKCKRSRSRWRERDSNWKGIHRETGKFIETKEDHEKWLAEVPYSDPTIEVEDSITVNFIPEEEEELEEEETE